MIPVILVWQGNRGGVPRNYRKHVLLPALPSTGDLMIPPGETKPKHVRAKEWDLSGERNPVIHIALD